MLFNLVSKSHESLVEVAYQFIDSSGAKISKIDFKDALLSHPDYPTLFSLTDILTQNKIDNKAVRVPITEMDKLPPNCFVQLIGEGVTFVKKVTSDSIVYFSEQNGWITESKETFPLKWTGVAVLIEGEVSQQKSPKPKAYLLERLAGYRNYLMILLLTVTGFIAGSYINSGLIFSFWITSMIGVFVSLILVLIRMKKGSFDKFCQIGKQVNCNTVLNSSFSKIGGWLPLADVSLSYFLGSFLILSFSSLISETTTLFLLSTVSILGVLVAFYSIYLQGVVLKKWCVYCLGIVFVLFVQSLLGGYAFYTFSTIDFSYDALLMSGLLFSIPAVGWSYLNPLIISDTKIAPVKHQLNRLKMNMNVFDHLQSEEQKLQMPWPADSIQLGRENAKQCIRLVLGPSCPICAKDFDVLYQWLKNGGEGIQFEILFATAKDDVFINYKLLELYQRLDKEEYLDVLSSWYNDPDSSKLKNQYGDVLSDESKKTHDEHYTWLRMMNISKVPVCYFNEQTVSKYYDLTDLINIIRINNS